MLNNKLFSVRDLFAATYSRVTMATILSSFFLALIVQVDVSIAANEEKLSSAKVGACSKSVKAAFKAGKNEIRDDFWIAYGKCSNLSDSGRRQECLATAHEDFADARNLIKDQRTARYDVCAAIGEEPYDPAINPDDFVDFGAVLAGEQNFTPNPYFPLKPGMTLIYLVKDGEGQKIERIKVEVLPEFKEILGINCIVVRDRVWEFDDEGKRVLIEDTFDWYAQDLLGNVWYFGEIAQNFEDGELVDLEGSWKAGKENDMPGYIMPADAQKGDIYRQEFSLGNAEDMGEVVGYLDSVVVNKVTYTKVLKTMDYTPVEPDVLEFTYYAPGIGVIVEENPESGERLELKRVIMP